MPITTTQTRTTSTVSGNMYEDSILSSYARDTQVVREEGALAIANGVDLASAVATTSSKGSEQIQHERGEALVQDVNDTIVQHLEITPSERQDIIREIVGIAPDLQAKALEMSDTLVGKYMAYLRGFPNSAYATDEEIGSAAVDLATTYMLQQSMDDYGFSDALLDFAGMVIVPDDALNMGVTVGEVEGNRQDFSNFIDSVEGQINLSNFRNSLSVGDRAYFDATVLLPAINKSDSDNYLQQLDQLQRIISTDPESEAVWQTAEKLGIVATTLGIGRKILNAGKGLSTLRNLAKVKHPEVVGALSEAVKNNPKVGKDVGVSVGDAATTGLPVKDIGKVFKGMPEGAQKEYRAVMEGVSEALGRMDNIYSYTISPDEVDLKNLMVKFKNNLGKDVDIEDINIVKGLEDYQINYKINKGGKVEEQSYTQEFVSDDLGRMNITKGSLTKAAIRGALSPNFLLTGDRELFVQAAEASLFSSSRILKSYSAAVDSALKPIKGSKASLKKLDMLMREVDGKDIDVSYQALVHDGIGGIKLSDKEYAAFAGIRRTLDDGHKLNDLNLARYLQLSGAKKVSIGDDVHYAKTYNDSADGYRAFVLDGGSKKISIFNEDGTLDFIEEVSKKDIDDMYAKGYVITGSRANSELGWFNGSDGMTKYALVHKRGISDIPNEGVLGKVPNYLPKIRKNANFFLKKKTKVLVDGRWKEVEKTIAYGPTHTEVSSYLAKVEKSAIESGGKFDKELYSIKAEGQVGKAWDDDTIQINGGLITGKRSSSAIEYVGDVEDDANRVDSINSLQKYFAITADRVAMGEWRMEAKARVLNEAASIPQIGPEVKRNWVSARALISNADIDESIKTQLLASYDQIEHLSRVPTKGEQYIKGLFSNIAKRFDKGGRTLGVKNTNIAKFMYGIDDSNPTNLLKSATYNLTLGAFNLAQIAVQASGATAALSISPVSASKSLHKWLIASALDLSSNERIAGKVIDTIASKMGIKDGSLVKDYDFWTRSGMKDSIINANSDAASLYNKLPYDAGVIRRTMHGIVEAGQTPYKIGELANMRISFFTALEDVKKVKGSAFKYTDKDMADVLARSEQLRFNMGNANKAAYQKGLIGVGTQFKQIYTKYLEAIAGDWFTKTEKAQLIGGQVVLFGSAGASMFGDVGDYLTKTIYGEEATYEQATAIKKGLVGWAFNDELGINSLLSERLALSPNLAKEFKNMLGSEGQPLSESVTGASFNTITRSGEILSDLWNGAVNTMYSDDKLSTIMATVSSLGRSMADMPAGSRSVLAAIELAGIDPIMRRRGGSSVDVEGQNLQTILARAAGFQLDTINDVYKGKEALSDLTKHRKAIAESTIKLILGFVQTTSKEGASEDEVLAAQKALGVRKQVLFNRYPKDAQAIWDMVSERVLDETTVESKTITDIINAQYTDLDKGGLTSNTLVRSHIKSIKEGE